MENREKTREEQNIETIEFNLQERIKELNCLHQMMGAMNDQSLSYDDFLERITQIIPPAWQFPEQTGVFLEIEGKVFKTPQYRSDSPKLSENIMIGGRTAGTIEVCLTGKPPVPDALTFLPEESQLLKSIALYLAAFIEKSEKEIALHNSEQKYRSILHASPDVITITDLEGKIIFASPRAVEMFGSENAEIFVGQSLLEYIDPSDHERAIAGITSMFEGRYLGADEYKGVRLDGSLFDIEVNGEVIRDEQGQPEKMIFVTRDITDRKAAERKLAKSEESFKNLIENLNDVVYEITNEGIVKYVSPSIEKFLGYTPDELIGKNFFQYMHEEDRPQIMQRLAQLNKRDYSFLEYRYWSKSGHIQWVRSSTNPILEDGKVKGGRGVLIDVTERRNAELKLAQSQEKYRSLIDSADASIIMFDRNGYHLYINEIGAGFLNLPADKIVGRNVTEMLRPEQARSILSNLEQVYSSNEGMAVEECIEVGGTSRWFRTSIQPVRDHFGKPYAVLVYATDITERRKAEEEMRKFRTIADMANYGIALAGMDGTMLYCNNAFAGMHGWDVSEVIGRNLSMFHSEEQMIRVGETIQLLQKNGQFTAEEVWRTRKDGSVFPSLMNAMIIMENNQPQFMSATAIDITDLKESEQKVRDLNANLEIKIAERTFQLAETNNYLLKEIEERKLIQEALSKKTSELETFFNVALDLLCIADTSGNFIKLNKAWSDILGYSSGDLENRQFLEFVHPDDLQPTLDAMSQLSDQHPILDFTNRYRTKDGTYRYIEWHSVPVGNLIYAAARDITGRIRNEEDLRNARREAERANLAKSEFLSRMSHELRTPMNSILGFAQLLEMGALNSGQKKGVNHILRSGKHLLELINEVLDIARIEAGRISLSLEPVQLSGVIREMIDTVQIIAAEYRISVELTETDDARRCVKADRQRLKQILLNLLNNAIKYNRKGGSVRIRADVMPGQVAEEVPIRISVTDTGHGISEEDLPKLFTPFERIGAEKTETEGTGLGLAVVKKLVEIMGGNIGVASIPGEGSTFWFEFMMVEDQLEHYKNGAAVANATSVNNDKKGCILYIEDNGPNIELVQEILETSRPEIRLVTTMYGKQAVEFAIEFKPGLILLDLNLPDMHGSEVLKNLLSEAKTKEIPVVVISADALLDQVEKLRRAGARDYLTKPLDVIHFLETVDQYLMVS